MRVGNNSEDEGYHSIVLNADPRDLSIHVSPNPLKG